MTIAKRKTRQRAEISSLAAQMERDLSAIRRAVRKPLEAEFAKGQLTVPQKTVMQAVVASHGISLKNLSREVGLAHSTVSGIVDRLERRGMIERRSDPADGRMTRIQPSAEVAAYVRERIPALAAGPLHSALALAHAAERAQIADAVRRLRELLEAG